MQFVDTHAHLTSKETKESVETLLKRAKEKNVLTIINICTDFESLKEGLLLDDETVSLYHVAGIPPHEAEKDFEEDLLRISEIAREKKLIAIGEVGLDAWEEKEPHSLQYPLLRRQVALAEELNLPLVFHCRNAFTSLFEVMESYRGKALIHCFTGTLDDAKEALKRGWLISLSGILTFKRSTSLREIVKKIPLESLVLETDTPYLAPQSRRGKPNEPSYLLETAEMLSKIHEISLETVAQVTTQNALNFFNLKGKNED